jgi:chromate transporter
MPRPASTAEATPRAASTAEATPRPASLTELFTAFTLLALQGFGGVLAISQAVLCEQKRWLTSEEYVEALAVGQLLPGANVCNLALIVGKRFFGWRGALAALAGLVTVPLAVVLGFTMLYLKFADVPQVSGALSGMGAVAAGFIVGTALKLVAALRGNPLKMPACATLVMLAFAMIALLRWPLVWVLPGLGALAFLMAWRRVGGLAHGTAGRETPQ